jgi:hypothetical protein
MLVSDVSGDGVGENLKALSYRDRDGAHEFPWVCRGTISAERILIALGAGEERLNVSE